MRKIVLVGAFLLMLPWMVSGQQAITAEEKKAASEVLGVIARWADAVRDRDVARLDEIFAEDVVITGVDGTARGKADELALYKRDGGGKVAAITNEDVGMRVFGDVAVVTSLMTMKGATETRVRYTAVFVKRDERWQIVALQAGLVKGS